MKKFTSSNKQFEALKKEREAKERRDAFIREVASWLEEEFFVNDLDRDEIGAFITGNRLFHQPEDAELPEGVVRAVAKLYVRSKLESRGSGVTTRPITEDERGPGSIYRLKKYFAALRQFSSLQRVTGQGNPAQIRNEEAFRSSDLHNALLDVRSLQLLEGMPDIAVTSVGPLALPTITVLNPEMSKADLCQAIKEVLEEREPGSVPGARTMTLERELLGRLAYQLCHGGCYIEDDDFYERLLGKWEGKARQYGFDYLTFISKNKRDRFRNLRVAVSQLEERLTADGSPSPFRRPHTIRED